MARCDRADVNEAAFSYYPCLGRLKRHCEVHLTETISLKKAAQIAGFEASYLSAYFHNKVGVCFKCWLALLRVQRAEDIMRSSDVPIARIAQDVGFHCQTSFERNFKRCTGITASQFKRSVRPS